MVISAARVVPSGLNATELTAPLRPARGRRPAAAGTPSRFVLSEALAFQSAEPSVHVQHRAAGNGRMSRKTGANGTREWTIDRCNRIVPGRSYEMTPE